MKRIFALALAAFLAAGTNALAQTATGNVYGKVTDSSGAVLPGSNVTIAGEAGSRSTVTGTNGEFRFLNLDVGSYTVTAGLTGFSKGSRTVTVVSGQSLDVTIGLKVGGLTDVVEVTANSDLVDVKKRGTSAVLSNQDLKDVPNSRDPFSIVTQVAGVLVDRVNIAGNENGQQVSFTAKGSQTADKVWTMDGLVITDMAATGASPGYYDFDAFQEINITTGGGELNMQTGGLGVNLVTKRGTNAFHGGGRYLVSDKGLQSSNLPDSLRNDPRLLGGTGECEAEGGPNAFRDSGDHINNIKDYGFDLGGPIIKDKLWFYGTYGKQNLKICRFSGTADDTVLPSYNAKLNWQVTSKTMASAFYFQSAKQKFGRAPGFAVPETDTMLWNQKGFATEGGLPYGLWKLELNQTFSPNFYMSAKAAYYDQGFTFASRGDAAKSYTLDYESGSAIGSVYAYQTARPQKTANVDGNYFFSGMGGNNELKFGFGYRKATTSSVSHYNGNQINAEYYGAGTGGGRNIGYITRDKVVAYGGTYASAYLGDVFTKNRFTVNVGIRIDQQKAKNLPSTAPANVSFPARLPAIEYTGSDNLFDLTDISPRLGFSYALDEKRKMVLRGSFARYGAQLAYGNVTTENPLGNSIIGYAWNDTNGDKFAQPNELNTSVATFSSGVDPNNPGSAAAGPNKIDRNLENRYDNEFILGLDRELGANLAVGGALTYRKSSGFQWLPRLAAPCPSATDCAIIPASAYTANAPLSATRDGVLYTAAPTYSPNAALVAAGGGGRFRTTQPGYNQQFKGIELTLNKRMSNKWSGKVAFSLNDWTEHFEGQPLNNSVTTTNASGSPTRTDVNPLVDGGQVSILSGGSGKASFYSSFKWQIYMNAFVRLPWSLDLAGAVFGRQGGTFPISINAAAGADGTRAALVGNVDDQRYDDLWNLDLRLARTIKVNRVSVTLSGELFNVLNNDLVMSRARNAGSATFGRVEEIISPRVVRLGARLSF